MVVAKPQIINIPVFCQGKSSRLSAEPLSVDSRPHLIEPKEDLVLSKLSFGVFGWVRGGPTSRFKASLG